MRSLARGAAVSVLGVLFLSSALFAQSLTVRVPRGNVRARPEKTSPVIGNVRKGEQYPIEARRGDWFKILLETGREGWVFKSLVEVSGKRTIGVVPTAPAKPGSSPYGDSWAIVVGINRYRKPALRLHYAVNDARSVTAALRKIGFPKNNIITLLDEGATARAIRTAFNTLITRTQGQDRVFIFIAAHGMTLDRPGGGAMGYLLPVEADPANIVGTAMPMSEVKDMASLLKAKHVFFAVDACFSGLLAARSVPRAEKRVDAAYLTRGRLRQILTAGERDQPVLEEGGHGLFTRRLLEAMEGEADNSPRDGVLTAMEVAAFVQGRVIASSSSRQTPFFGTMDGVGQFVFTAPGMGGVREPPETDLARMRAKLEERRKRLEAGKARLERERLEAEKARIEAEEKKLQIERKRIEEEKKRLAALKKNVGAGPRPGPSLRPSEPPRVAVGPSSPQQIGSGLGTMVKVPAGWFIMGSDDSLDDEEPERRVYLDGFFIDKYPVTNARFRRFGRPEKDYGSKFNGDHHPVVGVTWFQARDYCASVGKRLPTEAESEKAARGVDGRKYPWGSRWTGSKVIWDMNSGNKTHPVDRDYNTHRSPYDAVDMVGNTWEWVSDWYGENYYQNAPNRNPKGPSSGTYRVLRGGSWSDGNTLQFHAVILSGRPDFRINWLSFRCAKAP